MYLKILFMTLFIFTSIYAETYNYTMGERENQIQNTKLTHDNKYLEIVINGNFISKSNFELFINSDDNEATGYSKSGKIKGAEYLVENHTLFVYAGNGSDWKWTKLGQIESHASTISWNAKVRLSSLELNGGESIEYIAKVMTADWKKSTYGKGSSFSIQTKEEESVFSLTQNGDFSQFSHFSFFIDADKNPNTGYTKGKIKGADFLVEDNGCLYKYPKGATAWKWDKVQDGIVFTHTDTMMQMDISSVLLNNTNFITYYAMALTANWNRNVVFDAKILNHKSNIDNQIITYSELDGNVKNPERGLYANHYLASSAYRGYSTNAGKYSWIVNAGYKVFVEKLVLVDFRDKLISDEYLERVRKDFTFARQNGLKMIVRATYNEHQGDPDAPLDIVLNHIKQLKPIYNEYKDVIMSVEAGFIGAWGEWHHSSNGLNKDNQAKDAIKNALLKAIPSSIPVQFRNPPEIMRWYPTPLNVKDAYSGSAQSRVGFYDDCFNWNASDMGTFTGNSESMKKQKEYISQSSQFTPTVGETCPIDVSRGSTASCEGAIKLAEEIHLTSLGDSGDWHPEWIKPIDVYKNEGCWDEIVRRLGYRFVLKSATFSTITKLGSNFSAEIKIKNNGFASLVNRRDAYIVLENENKRVEFKLNTDPRKWEPNKITTIKFYTKLPNSLIAGTYKVALWLPDFHKNLKYNLKYAIRTANTNTWDSQKGYNILGEVEVISKDTLAVKKNRINSTNISNDNKSLIINVNGSFVPKSNFTLFMNTDNDRNTGYKRADGIDYLVQNHTLFMYSGNGNNWKWTKIGKIKSHMTATSWKAVIPLSVLDLRGKKKITTAVKIFTKDWKIATSSKIKSYTLSEINKDIIPIVIIGPSTTYIGSELNGAIHPDGSDCRLEGWGERLYTYVSNPNFVYNYARPGSSSTSFPEPPEGKNADVQTLYGPNRDHYWAKAVDKMKKLGKGILLIQYGANEPATTNETSFKENIQNYIDKAKELHFTPVLITEIEKRIRNNNGTLWHARANYPKWMKEIAADNNLRVLDLNKKSYDEYSKYTVAQWHEIFTDCSSRWGNHQEENTHYEAKGAKVVASWIKNLACEKQNSMLCKQLQGVPKAFTLSSPNFIPNHGSPIFSWKNVPKGTKSFVLIIDDKSAKDGRLDWVHWSVININKNTRTIAARTVPTASKVGINSNGVNRYSDPTYPDTHKYVAHVYALDAVDVMNAKFFNGAKNFSLLKKYDHKEFERVFSLFILGKSEIISR